LLGFGGNYEFSGRTQLSGDYDFSRFVSEAMSGGDTETVTNAFRLGLDSRPVEWFGLSGSVSRNTTRYEQDSTTQQFADLTGTLYPFASLRFSVAVGSRTFDDVSQKRTVTFGTVGAAYTDQVREGILLGVNLSRSYETDPSQADNIRDNLGVNTTMVLTPHITLRANLNINRNENRSFISNKSFDASGTLAERDLLDANSGGLPAGYVFYDTVNSNLYTKNSAAVGDWSLPTHFELETEQFYVSKNLQLNATPTEKSSIALAYASSASSNVLDIGRVGNQSLSGSFTYLPNRRTSLSIAGTATLPETGMESYSGTTTAAYRFFRGHQLTASYGMQRSAGRTSDNLSASLTLALRKRSALDITYTASQPFDIDQSYLVRVRFSKSF
jgi:hypothetical protein